MLMTVCATVMAQEKEHTVARGETMASIAKLYGLTEDQLKAANPNTSLCFAGMKLTIPDPNAAKEGESSAKDKNGKDEKAKNDDEKGGGLKKLVNAVGDALGDAAKVSGAVLSAAAYTKLHGGSTYDVIANSIEAGSNKLSGKDNEFTIRGQKVTKKKRSGSGDQEVDSDDSDEDADSGDSSDDKQKKKKAGTADKKEKTEETDPELEEMYQTYVTNYTQMATEMEQLKDVYTKANNTAKIRTWNNVSESANAYRQQMEKLRADCEKFTGKLIETSPVESWRPVSPKK